MKDSKLVYLNKGFRMSREKDLEQAEEKIKEMIDQGWELQQIVSPDDGIGALIGVFLQRKQTVADQRTGTIRCWPALIYNNGLLLQRIPC